MSSGEPHSSSIRELSPPAEPAWELIAERLDGFAAAWERALQNQSDSPQVGDFLQGVTDEDAKVLAVELVKFDLEHRWLHAKSPQKLEWYVEQVPQLGSLDALPGELIYEEVQARVQAGEGVDDVELRRRFPRQAAGVCNLLGGMSAPGSPTCTHFTDTVVGADATARSPKQSRAAAPHANLNPGDSIDDFQLITPLGSGAFAKVFLARQKSMERLVALKISRAVGSEPQTLAQLDHPHVVRVYDQRTTEDPPARLLYMEVVPGGTLQDALHRVRDSYDGRPSGDALLTAIDARLTAVGSLPPVGSERRTWIEDAPWADIVAKVGCELAEGLAYAHSRGVLHRDIKPANVLLTADAAAKLADFNVSYNGGRADEDPTDSFGGSLAYMSPEQLEACHPLLGGSPRLVRAASDVYSLGVMLWEMLAGRRPFADEAIPASGGSLARLQRMIDVRRRFQVDELAQKLPADCPPALKETLLKALAPETKDRFATAQDFARALQLCLHKRCWQLLQRPTKSFGRFVLARPVLSVVLAGLIPNAMVAAYNFNYNKLRLENDVSFASIRDALMDTFNTVQFWVNGLAFPIGVAIGGAVAWKTLRMLIPNAPRTASVGSTRLLLFGRFLSIMLLTLWTVAGAAFPIAMAWRHPELRNASFQVHFFVSLALAGFAAIAYPYLIVTHMVVRYFVPDQMRRGVIVGPRKATLARVARLNRVHLALAGLVPLLGGFLIVTWGDESQAKWLLQFVMGGGLLAFAAMFFLEREIDHDLRALAHVAVDDRANAAWIQSIEDSQEIRRTSGGDGRGPSTDVRLADESSVN